MIRKIEDMTFDELTAELKLLKENLCDLEDMHAFTFEKTGVHIGAERAQNLQAEYEEECRIYNERIASIERLLEKKRPI
jgi:hypothetical protein